MDILDTLGRRVLQGKPSFGRETLELFTVYVEQALVVILKELAPMIGNTNNSDFLLVPRPLEELVGHPREQVAIVVRLRGVR